MPTRRVVAAHLSALALTASGVMPAGAQLASYPVKPVTIVVGFSAGGSSDALAGIVAEKLAICPGQPVLVENRPGVASIVGAPFVANAKPDDYTLFMGAGGPNVFNYALYAGLPYALQEFAPWCRPAAHLRNFRRSLPSRSRSGCNWRWTTTSRPTSRNLVGR